MRNLDELSQSQLVEYAAYLSNRIASIQQRCFENQVRLDESRAHSPKSAKFKSHASLGLFLIGVATAPFDLGLGLITLLSGALAVDASISAEEAARRYQGMVEELERDELNLFRIRQEVQRVTRIIEQT